MRSWYRVTCCCYEVHVSSMSRCWLVNLCQLWRLVAIVLRNLCRWQFSTFLWYDNGHYHRFVVSRLQLWLPSFHGFILPSFHSLIMILYIVHVWLCCRCHHFWLAPLIVYSAATTTTTTKVQIIVTLHKKSYWGTLHFKRAVSQYSQW